MTNPIKASAVRDLALLSADLASVNLSAEKAIFDIKGLPNISSKAVFSKIYSNAMEQVRSKFSLSSAQELGGAFRTSVIAVQSESDPQQYLISIGSGSLLTPLSQGENGALARDYAATLTYVDSIRKQILAQDRQARVDVVGAYNGGTLAKAYSTLTGANAISFNSSVLDAGILGSVDRYARENLGYPLGVQFEDYPDLRVNFTTFQLETAAPYETSIRAAVNSDARAFDETLAPALDVVNILSGVKSGGDGFYDLFKAIKSANRTDSLIAVAGDLSFQRATEYGSDFSKKNFQFEVPTDVPGFLAGVAKRWGLESQGDIQSIRFDNELITFGADRAIVDTPQMRIEDELRWYAYSQAELSRVVRDALVQDPLIVDKILKNRGFSKPFSNLTFKEYIYQKSLYGEFRQSILNEAVPVEISSTWNIRNHQPVIDGYLQAFTDSMLRAGATPSEADISLFYNRMGILFGPDGPMEGRFDSIGSVQARKYLVDGTVADALDVRPAASRKYVPTCFPAGTEVTLADGSTRPIETLSVGDEILCFPVADAAAGALITGRIAGFRQLTAPGLVRSNVFNATADHEFVMADGSFRTAGKIEVGDRIATADGTATVEWTAVIDKSVDVYSIAVEPHPTYIADGNRVHNEALCNPEQTQVQLAPNRNAVLQQNLDGSFTVSVVTDQGREVERYDVTSEAAIKRVWSEYSDFTGIEEPDSNGIRRSRLSGAAQAVVWKGEIAKGKRIDTAGALGASFGSTLGNILGQSAAGKIVLSGALATVLENIFEVIANGGGGTLPLTRKEVLANIETEFAGNIIGAASSYLIASLINEIGIDGIPGQVLQTGLNNVISTVSQNLLKGATNPFEGIGGGLANAGAAFLGTKLASELVRFDTIGGQIGSSLGSSAGSILGVASVVGTGFEATLLGVKLGAWAGPVGALAGAFLGFIVGGLIGSVFGGTPRSGADVIWDPETQSFDVANSYSRKGGSRDAAISVASSVAATFNSVLATIGGRLATPEKVQAGNYGMRKSEFVYRPWSTRDDSAITRRYSGQKGAEKLIAYGAYNGLTDPDFQILGGSVILKRAFYNGLKLSGIDRENFDSNIVFGNLAAGARYEQFLAASSSVLALIASEPTTKFAAEWAIVFARANELGLNQRAASDWFGGFGYFLEQLGATAAELSVDFGIESSIGLPYRRFRAGAYEVEDTIDITNQTEIAGSANNDLIDLHGNMVQGQRGARNSGNGTSEAPLFSVRADPNSAGQFQLVQQTATNKEAIEYYYPELAAIDGGGLISTAVNATVRVEDGNDSQRLEYDYSHYGMASTYIRYKIIDEDDNDGFVISNVSWESDSLGSWDVSVRYIGNGKMDLNIYDRYYNSHYGSSGTIYWTITDRNGYGTSTKFSEFVYVEGWPWDQPLPPVVLDLDGDGIELVSLQESDVYFDMNGDGAEDRTGWVAADDGFLVLDRDGSGAIDRYNELSFAADYAGAVSDLEGLRAYDSNGNDYFDAGDAEFARFQIWQDRNQDGISQADELSTLAESRISAIRLSLDKTGAPVDGATDNVFYAYSSFVRTNGTGGDVGDVFLAYEDAASVADEEPVFYAQDAMIADDEDSARDTPKIRFSGLADGESPDRPATADESSADETVEASMTATEAPPQSRASAAPSPRTFAATPEDQGIAVKKTPAAVYADAAPAEAGDARPAEAARLVAGWQPLGEAWSADQPERVAAGDDRDPLAKAIAILGDAAPISLNAADRASLIGGETGQRGAGVAQGAAPDALNRLLVAMAGFHAGEGVGAITQPPLPVADEIAQLAPAL